MPITVDAKFFQTGYTWDEYITTIVKKNKEALQSRYEHDQSITLDPSKLAQLKEKTPYWMIIAEDWCYDSVGFLPMVVRLAEAAGVDLRIWPRDKNLELMDQYLTHNKRKIPITIFFDQDLKEIGRWIERPKGAHQLVKKLQADMHKAMRKEYNTGRFSLEVVNEISIVLRLD